MTHPLVGAVRDALRAAADPVRAPQMQRYMKSTMPFRGVPAPVQKRLWREIFPAHPLESQRAWQRVALELWRGARFREERYAAIALTDLRVHAPFRTPSAIPMFEEMIVTGAWWDYVDAIATHQLGDVLRAATAPTSALMRRWARVPDMWKRRAALLCQIRFKQDTDLKLLYACIEPNLLPSPRVRAPDARLAHEFFIRKAIGWALRAYAWVDPREVQRYVKEHRSRLSPLSIREALKNVR